MRIVREFLLVRDFTFVRNVMGIGLRFGFGLFLPLNWLFLNKNDQLT